MRGKERKDTRISEKITYSLLRSAAPLLSLVTTKNSCFQDEKRYSINKQWVICYQILTKEGIVDSIVTLATASTTCQSTTTTSTTCQLYHSRNECFLSLRNRPLWPLVNYIIRIMNASCLLETDLRTPIPSNSRLSPHSHTYLELEIQLLSKSWDTWLSTRLLETPWVPFHHPLM